MKETKETNQNNEQKEIGGDLPKNLPKAQHKQKRIKGKIFSFMITDEDAIEYDKICALQSLDLFRN